MAKTTKGKGPQIRTGQKELRKKPKRRIDWMSVTIILLCLALYIITAWNKYAMDDELVTTDKAKYVNNGLAGIPKIFTSLYSEGKLNYEYRPIVKLTYAIEYQFFGASPAASHLINILLYTFTCLVLFRVLKRLMQNYDKLFILFIVLLFLAHPVHTEVVASLKNRDEMLSFMFSLVSMNYLISFVKENKWISLLLAFLFYILAYLSKASALVFLALFPLVLYFFTDVSWKKLAMIFGIIVVAMVLSRYGPKTYLPRPDRDVFFFENPLFFYKNIMIRFATGMMSLLFYLKILIYPHPLLFYYGYDMIPVSHLKDGWVIVGIIIHLALFVYAVWKIKSKHILSFAILFYLISISMFSNIVKPAMGIVAERFVYAASLGFCIVVAYFIFRLFRKEPGVNAITVADRKKLLIPLIIILIPYSAKTISRNTSWKDRITLYTNDIRHLNKSAKANSLIAGQIMQELNEKIFKGKAPADINKQIDLIYKYYSRSIEIYPDYYSSYNNIGSIYFTLLAGFAKNSGDTAQATVYYKTGISYFRKAVSMKTDYTEAFFNLAYSYEMISKYDSAIYYYRKNIALKPDNIRSLSNMANLYFNKLKNYDSAVSINKRIMNIDTTSDSPYVNLGTYALKKGDTSTAINYYETAVKKFPKNFELASKLSRYYRGRDNEKYLKYQKMATDAKKEFMEKE